MNLNDIERLIELGTTNGKVNYRREIIDKYGVLNNIMVVEIGKGFVTAIDDGQNNIKIKGTINEGDIVKVLIEDGIIVWSKETNDNPSYTIPYCVDESQIVKPIKDIPEIRVYSYDGTHEKFSCFKLAWKYYLNCKDTSNLQMPVIAFDRIEVSIYDIRRE